MRQPEVEALTDDELLGRARQGCRRSVEVLWSRNYAAALVCARSVWLPGEAEDLVSEAFVKVLRAIKRGGGPSEDFRRYLFAAVRNMAKDWHNKCPETVWALDEATSGIPQVEASVLNDADGEMIRRVFYAMPERQREILWLSEVEGLRPRDIAGRVGLGARHVSTLLDRAKKTFDILWCQQHLSAKGVEPDSEHAWVLGHAGEVIAGRPALRTSRRVEAHLDECAGCAEQVDEAARTSRRLGRSLAIATTGSAVTAFLSAPSAHAVTAAAVRPPGLPARALAEFRVEQPGSWTTAAVAGISVIATATGLAVWLWTEPASVAAPAPNLIAAAIPPTPTPAPTTAALPPAVLSPTPTAPATRTPKPPPSAVVKPTPAKPSRAKPASTAPAPRPAITITGVDAGPGGLCYPVVTGTALPGSTITFAGTTAKTGADGAWATGPITSLRPGTHPVAATADRQAPVSLRVTIAPPPTLTLTATTDGLLVSIRGHSGVPVGVLVDGRVSATPVLDAQGRASVTLPDTDEPATVAVRYQPGDCVGPTNTMGD